MKPRLLDDTRLAQLAREHGTPLWVYDASVIAARIRDLSRFDVVRFAQKANQNLAVLAVVRRNGALVDAVSAGEVVRARAAGFAAEDIVFTADLFDRAALAVLADEPCPLNLGSAFMLDDVARHFPDRRVTVRVNPGFGHGHARRVSTGGESSKHGIWHADVPAVIARARKLGLRVRGMHVHIGSGSDFENLTRVCDAVARLAHVFGEDLDAVSAGGGLPIPYRASEPPFDVARFTDTWLATRERIQREMGRPISLEVEPGRYLVAEAGCLLTEVRGLKTSGATRYAIVDAGFNHLVRPAMYGAYHQISYVGRSAAEHVLPIVVAGPLCESGDVFTQGSDGVLEPQALPELAAGDLLCIHDAGAYGAAMSSNYNAQPFAPEVLVENGEAKLVRRRQTLDEMLANER